MDSASAFSDFKGSQESCNVALQWIDDCQHKHAECQFPEDSVWYPTKLLDIGLKESDQVRLIITEAEALHGEYITLSHCWGKAPTFKLDRRTFHRLRSDIQATELPMVFQHAISIAHRLARTYLWIDSMCIIQDSDDHTDWLKEAQTMHMIYANAFLNISATGQRDGAHGLFVSRDPQSELAPTKILWTPPDARSADDAAEAYIFSEFLFLARQLMNEPIHRKGWVLQERLLAKRVLHFSSTQLLWECKHGVLCERYPRTLPKYMQSLGPATFKSLDKAYKDIIRPTAQGAKPHPTAFSLWKKVMEAYSRSILTFSSDKMIALSGIAKIARETFRDEYVAGMWRTCLESQLLWNIDKTRQVNGEASTRGTGYRAPTWSWMSVDGKVSAGTYSRTGLWAEVLDVQLQHTTSDTTRNLLASSLTLRGRL